MITIIILLFRVFEMFIVVRVILSWVRVNPDNPIVEWLDRLTDPVLEPIRRWLPVERIGFDFSPLVALFLIELVERIIIQAIL